MMLDFTSLNDYIKCSIKLHVKNVNNNEHYDIEELRESLKETPDLGWSKSIVSCQISPEEQIILLLALAPYFSPQVLDIFLAKNPSFDTICTEFGGVTQAPHRGVIPTGETAVFLLAARDLKRRKEIAQLLLPEGKLAKQNLVELESVSAELPVLSGKLLPHQDLIQLLMYGEIKPPKLSPEFPAQLLETDMEWEDLIIGEHTRDQLRDLENWLSYYEQLAAHPELGKRTKKGYKTLFYGPPGTGKTLTASLLGKAANRPVFRIDLSLLVSKYIGETEKNLSGIFKRAEHKNWILFFDEADALFGKRTETENSNDRFANQEVAYLLQRIENYNGMVILASNLKQNIDSAFIRRFQSMIYFPKPGKLERELIWKKTVPTDLPFEESIDLLRLTDAYELTASQISNIVQACYIDAVAGDHKRITQGILMKNLRLEFKKEDLLFEDVL